MFAKGLDFKCCLLSQSFITLSIYLPLLVSVEQSLMRTYVLLHKHTVTVSESFFKTQKCSLDYDIKIRTISI